MSHDIRPGDRETFRVLDTDQRTPTGGDAVLIECNCGAHPTGNRALMRAEAAPGLRANGEKVHGFVNLAHHPALSRAPQIRRNGPWEVEQ